MHLGPGPLPRTRPSVVAGYRSDRGHHGTHAFGAPSIRRRAAGWLLALAIVFSTALLVILNGSPGWQALPFLTSDTTQVLGLVNLCLAAGIAANLVYLAYDPPWLKSLGDLATTGIGLATHPGRVTCPAGNRPGSVGGPVPAGTGVLVHRSTATTRLQSAYLDDKVPRKRYLRAGLGRGRSRDVIRPPVRSSPIA